ncbi:MAG TPA: class I SAM-dependent methyltransferase [Thermoanaerobaculia bacterium]|jgi:demethylmenaquinone methyltransferase/2-methoxy-6-polyprenyl-1,4-benzoquinol methylase|nr:class I SAM-dependent methyltransferase [Thermoanaerobaculia bacterium]
MSSPDPLRPHPVLTRYYQDEEQRLRRVSSWFDEAAGDYDWLNQAASFGSGARYRKQALVRSGLTEGMSLLDAGSGTGVIAAQGQEIVGRRGLVVALDPSLGMMSHAARRGVRRRVRGIAEALPFPDGQFDRLIMGYALRHVADLRATFQEYLRVLKPGGKVLLLEITRPSSRVQHAVLAFYLGRVVPFLARFGRGGKSSRELMEYYWDTVENCVPPGVILEALVDAGFSNVERRVQNGILSEYTGVR